MRLEFHTIELNENGLFLLYFSNTMPTGIKNRKALFCFKNKAFYCLEYDIPPFLGESLLLLGN